MHYTTKFAVVAAGVLALAGCVEDGGSSVAAPSAAEQACLQRTSIETGNGDVVVLSSSFSQAGTEVIVGVGPQRARWQCIAYSDGSTTQPMSLTNEGFL
ncbi:hypothetical protein [Silicimonas sp. MF1-12-2]|uniref:hypothetical protein n=1 Tax=Silicimonas sp. MF1-12-2 TaxID=3384793 RepID=UPI0039B50973